MITVHIIFNAHIDPVWLWPWQAGVDAALATCRSVCDRLDAHPDIFFTRGEAWIYQQIERLDPELFARISKHVETGRWEIVNGWWIQPDCNAPSGFAMEKQISLGREYFQEKFGRFPRIGYNVDSFGHAATLPKYLREAGQDRYVMMRPQEHERKLPARLFRWRGYEGEREVTTFRIAGGYNHQENADRAIDQAIEHLPEGCQHTMLFMGVGDHGGGPTERLIAWVRNRMETRKDVRLQFSTVGRFFDAIEPMQQKLPLVTGELQMHAVGCYSVTRSVKTALRKAEHRMFQAEQAAVEPSAQSSSAEFKQAWRHVIFHQFHDTLGGTCIPSAYPQVLDQLGYACTVADEALQYAVRDRARALRPDAEQRLVFFNASDVAFDDYVEAEPWLEWRGLKSDDRLIDEQGNSVPFQAMETEALIAWKPARMLLHLHAPAGGLCVLRLARRGGQPPANSLRGAIDRIENNLGFAFDGRAAILPGLEPLACRLELIPDYTDTWSHGADRFSEGPIHSPHYEATSLLNSGPLMAALARSGKIGDSTIEEEWRVYAGSAWIELRLTIHWRQKFGLLKFTVPIHELGQMATRIDGIMGGELQRPNDGKEIPLRDFMWFEGPKTKLGIVCPEVYAADVTPQRIRFTLLRSPMMAWHDPYRAVTPRATFSDQGTHQFRFRFHAGEDMSPRILDAQATGLQRPLVFCDLTRGMRSDSVS